MAGESRDSYSNMEQQPLLSQTDDGFIQQSAPPPGLECREAVERSLLWKLDLRMTMLVVIYVLNHVDRSSAAAARLRGFERDLGLSGTQFATILSAFYIGYTPMQVPSLTTNYHGALVTRFLLGFVEAGFYPGALYLISRWYKRNELSERTAYFTCGVFFGEAFGSLIASGILDTMNGVLGYTAWRWLFFVEGGLTVMVAITAVFVLPDFPETKTIPWLTSAEHALARRRMLEDADGSFSGSDSVSLADAVGGFVLACADWKVWYIAIALYFAILSVSFSIYFPTLAATMGYDAATSLLLCVPPWVATAAGAIWISRHSDRAEERCMHVIIPLVVGIVGFVLAMSTMNVVIRYFSLFLMAQSNAGSICLLAWASATVSNPPAKRAVALALINAISQSSNIVGAYVWVREWGPTYNKSYMICILTSLVSIVMCLWLRRVLRHLNRELDQEERRGRTLDGSGKQWRFHL